MEDNREKRDYTNRQNGVQKFYFGEDGKLVVESNKGVWVDGEQYVKMYGNFQCNARTMGIIIEKFKGIKVDVEMSTEEDNLLKMYTERLEEVSKLTEETTRQMIEIAMTKKEKQTVEEKVVAFNALPWYERLFKKIQL